MRTRDHSRRSGRFADARSSLVVLLASVVVMLASSGQAWALGERGHVFAGTFEGGGEHQLVRPEYLAVDEASGEVYVVDHSSPHEQVERFKPDGHGGYEFVAAFAVRSPEVIAVDNSTDLADPSRGDVYVVGAEEEGADPEEHDVIYKYSPVAGKVVSKRTIFHAEKEELELEEVYGVAVDAAGTLWVYWGEEGVISGFTDAEAYRWEPKLTKETGVEQAYGCRARPGFAVASDARSFYAAHERETVTEECPEEDSSPVAVAKTDSAGRLVAAGLDGEPTTGVGVSLEDGAVYADNVSHVVAFTGDGEFVQSFGAGALAGGAGLTVDDASAEIFVAEPASGKVAIFAGENAGPPAVDALSAQNLTPASERITARIDPNGAQTSYYVQYGTASCVGDPSACTDVPLPPGSAVGSGFGDETVNEELSDLLPDTTYFYRVLAHNEHGSAESAESTKTFFTTLPSAAGVLVDSREWELVSPAEKHGATIEPISREGALIQAAFDGSALAWAAGAPVEDEPEGNRRPEPVQVISTRTSSGWSSRDITTPHDRGEGYRTGQPTEYRAFSQDLALAAVEPQIPAEPFENPPLAPGATEKTIYQRNNETGSYLPLVTAENDLADSHFGGKLEFADATADLTHVVFSSQVPLLADVPGEGLYEWESGAPLRLVSRLPGSEQIPAGEPQLGDRGIDVRGAISSDGARVFWTDGGEEGPLYMRDTTTSETVQVNAAQGGASEPDAEEREEGLDEVHFQSASSDGSHVFFTDTWPLTPESTLEPLEHEEVVEEAPAGDITLPRAVDLYEYDVESGELADLTAEQRVGERAEVLGTIPGIGDDGSYVYFVANGILAPGAEAGDCLRAKPLLPHPEANCNLYMSAPDPGHPGQRVTRLVARLSQEDAGDWALAHSQPGSLGSLTAQVSANGRYLVFMSQRELTGYPNVDASAGAQGAHDEEVFLYDALTGRLTCASCNPSGAPPHGVYDTEAADEGLGLVVDRPEIWSGKWLAGSVPGWTLVGLAPPLTSYQSRYLSDDGRLFFNSPDTLVSQDLAPTRSETIAGKSQSVGVENVYEYEPDGAGSCAHASGCVALVSAGTSEHESAFLDASESGNDVFFLTAAQLAAQDTDTGYDVYDARVCGTTTTEPCLPVAPPPPPSCSGEECRPSSSSTSQAFTPPITSTYRGPGNPTGQQPASQTKAQVSRRAKPKTRAQKLAAALKLCRRIRHKHQRARCEKGARRRYGVKAAARNPPAGRFASRHGSGR
jgi:hypothetical protein